MWFLLLDRFQVTLISTPREPDYVCKFFQLLAKKKNSTLLVKEYAAMVSTNSLLVRYEVVAVSKKAQLAPCLPVLVHVHYIGLRVSILVVRAATTYQLWYWNLLKQFVLDTSGLIRIQCQWLGTTMVSSKQTMTALLTSAKSALPLISKRAHWSLFILVKVSRFLDTCRSSWLTIP